MRREDYSELFLKLASYYFVQARFQPSNITATGVFNPYVAAGFPVAIMDPHDAGVYYTGQLLSVTHNVSQSDATTSYTVGFARKTDEIDEIFQGSSLSGKKSYRMEAKTVSFDGDDLLTTTPTLIPTSTGAVQINSLGRDVATLLQDASPNAPFIKDVVILDAGQGAARDNLGLEAENVKISDIVSVGVYVEDERPPTPMAEELARPTWFSDDYNVKNVGERIYQKLLGVGSILDNLPSDVPRNATITVNNAQEPFVQTADALDHFRRQYTNASLRSREAAEVFTKMSTFRPIASIADVRRMFSDLSSRFNRVSTNERCLPGTVVSAESEQTRQNMLDPSKLHEEKSLAVSAYKGSVSWRAKR